MVHLIIATSKKLSTTRASIIQIPYLRMICTINSNQDQQDLLQMIFLIPGQNCMHHLQPWSSSAAPFPLLLGILFTKDTTNEWSLKNQRSHKCRSAALQHHQRLCTRLTPVPIQSSQLTSPATARTILANPAGLKVTGKSKIWHKRSKIAMRSSSYLRHRTTLCGSFLAPT